jgi:HEAT repeat protein
MATFRKIEETLSQIAALGSADAAELIRELPAFLGSAANIVVAKAAKLAGMPGVATAIEADLVKAFTRFLAKGGGSDRGCPAKQAIATTLYQSECASAETTGVFLTGVRWVQKEPGYGGSTDSADELRGICAMGLVRAGYPRVMEILVDLLADDSAQSRMMAIHALAYANQDSGALLLRLKILAGDADDRVISEAITALGQISGIRALDFLRRLLAGGADGSLFSAAAMAIGEMKHTDALEALLTVWRETMAREVRESLLLPIALCRLPAAVEFILGVVKESPGMLACAAIEALAMYQHDPQQREKIIAAVRERNEEAVTKKLERTFSSR